MGNTTALKVLCTTLLIEKSPQALPLGVACIASAIKNDPRTKDFYDVELQDFCLEDPEMAGIFAGATDGGKEAAEERAGLYLAGELAKKEPRIVLFSVYVWNHVVLERAARCLKKIKPEIITVAGGPEVTASPFVFEGFDYTIAGAGEEASVLLLEALAKNGEKNKLPQIPGLYFLDGKPGVFEFRRTAPCSPDRLYSPYLDGTLDVSRYGGALWELARGCPFKCSYCYESKGEKKVSYFPMERIKKEIELFAEKKVPQVFVLDPTYNASKDRALKMLRLIEEKTPDTFYYFEARAEFIDRELAKAFSRVHCALQIGMQSADPEVLKNVNRTMDRKKFIKNIGYLNEEGVTFGFDLIYGLPGDTLKGFKNSIDFALSLYPNNLELFCLSVLPGTDLYDSAEEFSLVWQHQPPYNVLSTPQFPEGELKKAASLAKAVNLFYTKGRAVSWFNCVVYHLHKKPTAFLGEFEKYLKEEKVSLLPEPSLLEIRKLQKDFVKRQFAKARLEKYTDIVLDMIELYGAMSDADGEGKSSTVKLRYWPEDVLSEYAMDLPFFCANAESHRCTVKVQPSAEGAVFKIL